MKLFGTILHQCNVWVIIFLKQALNGFTALSTSLFLQKIAWASFMWVTPYLAVNCLYSWNEYGPGSIVRYNFLKYPCLAKIDFVRDYLRRLSIQFTYFNIPGVIIKYVDAFQ